MPRLMTLERWVHTLKHDHPARIEYDEMVAEMERLKARIAELLERAADKVKAGAK